MGESTGFPSSAPGRDRFILERRGARPDHDPWRQQGVIVEDERQDDGSVARIGTVFLTGRECPWRCTMCDLWRYTTLGDTPIGAIPWQIADARRAIHDDLRPVAALKLYNAGSFFDPRAVPEADYGSIGGALAGLSRVIVESHPALIGARVDQFLAVLARHDHSPAPALEIAMGLETAHPGALERLNKRLTVKQFRTAADVLRARGVALRVFLLIAPPFVPSEHQDDWLRQSLDAAFACGASAVSLIPTRSGNGAMDAFAATGEFREPDLDDIERSVALAIAHARQRGRVFVDLWELARFSRCTQCFDARRARLHEMNLQQVLLPPHACAAGVHTVVA